MIRNIWNRILAYFSKEKWAYVHMFTIDNVRHEGKNGKVYIHCYESDKNNRKVTTTSTFPDVDQKMIDNFVRSNEIYQERLVRWLSGRYDPKILRFSQVGEDDTSNALKGSIE